MKEDSCYYFLRKYHLEVGRPISIACDWDEVMYMTEQECFTRIIERNPGLFPPAIVQASRRSDELSDLTNYPHGEYWNISNRMNVQDMARRIFFEPDIFNHNRVIDTYDALVQGINEGFIYRLVFLTYSPRTSKGLDTRKKNIFNHFFKTRYPNIDITMVILPYNLKGLPYEKGLLLGKVCQSIDLFIDNHLEFLKWALVYSDVKNYLIPNFNQIIKPSLRAHINLKNANVCFYTPKLSNLLKSYEY